MSYSSYSKGSLPYSKESKDNRSGSEMCRSVSWIRILLVRFIKFCEAYGAILAYYGSAFGALFSCICVTVLNEYEGGCKYPYLSEVARNGMGWWSFFIGTMIGCIPWILFSWDYYNTFKLYAISIENPCSRISFIWRQRLVYLLNVISALGMHGTAYFDMGHYPMTHEICVILFAAPCNLVFLFNLYDMMVVIKEKDRKSTWFRIFLLVCSLGGIILFTLLGRIEECKSVVITIEECLTHTSENECFKYIDYYNDGWTVLRHYPRCHVMHFWRGFAEFLAVLCSAEYVGQLYYDRNKVQLLLFKEYGILPKNSYVLRELSEEDESLCNALAPSTVKEITI